MNLAEGDQNNGGSHGGSTQIAQSSDSSTPPLEQGVAEPYGDKSAPPSPSEGVPKRQRWYYMDYMRSFTVHVVVVLHCINTTDKVTKHSEHNVIWKEKMEYIFRYWVQIGIPLFFLLSGMGAIYFDTEKKGFLKYTKNKIQRLLYPMIFAILVFLVPRLYISQGWETIGRLGKDKHQEWNIFKYYGQILLTNLLMKMGPLWFLPVLMMICIINYPLIAWSQRRAKKLPLDKQDLKIFVAQAIMILFHTIHGYFEIQIKSNFWNYIVPANLILLFGMWAFMGFQVYLQRLQANEIRFVFWLLMVGPIISIGFNFLKKETVEKTTYGISMMMNYHTMFFAQGIVNQTWRDKLQEHANYRADAPWYPFVIIGLVLLYGIGLPGIYSNAGFMFFYPIYGDYPQITMFTNGTWLMAYTLEYYMRNTCNFCVNEKFFKFYTTGSLFVYLCHDLWITAIATYILIPNIKENNPRVEGISFSFALFIMIFGVEILSNLTFYTFVKIFEICCAKKKKGRKEKDKKENGVKNIRDKHRQQSQDKIEEVKEEEEEDEQLQKTTTTRENQIQYSGTSGINQTMDRDMEDEDDWKK